MVPVGARPSSRPLPERLPLWGILGAVAAAVGGAAVVRSPALAALGIGALAAAAALLRLGFATAVGGGFAVLPWMVLFDDLIPPLLRTFTAAAAAVLLLAATGPPAVRGVAAPVGAVLFSLILLGQSIYAPGTEELIQAAKDIVFPVMVLCILSPRGREVLHGQRKLLVGSGIAAMVVHLAIVAVGLGSVGTYYGIGERLGFAPAIPHELALVGVIVAAAGVTVARRVSTQVLFFAAGAVPAALTGVRSALLSVALILVLILLQNRFSLRTMAAIAGIVVVALASGAADTITARFDRQSVELSGGVQSLGSGRGTIWTAAVSQWSDDGPLAWTFGSGLRAVNTFELAELGVEFVGHSDLVEILVDFGVVGLLAWLLLWFALLREGLGRLVLVPVLVYALVNGAIEYVGPLAFGLALAAAIARPPQGSATAEAGAVGRPAA